MTSWALVGVGYIAERFMQSLQYVEGASVVAAYGRTGEKLNAFCDRWSIKDRYTDCNEMYSRNDIDLIYLATPHVVHYKYALSAIEHGKNVLCEKPMTMSAEEAQLLVERARKKGTFLMEAMWTRFFPATVWLREFIQEGRFGEPLNVNAEFSFEYPYDADYRFFRRDLGGGCMRGAGIYPLSYACMVFKAYPSEFSAFCEMKNDVDVRTAAILRFPGKHGRTAELYTGFQGQSCCMANIAFEKGGVFIPDFIYPDRVILLDDKGNQIGQKEFPYSKPGLQFEIEHVMNCVQNGLKESPIMPLDETVAISDVTDRIYKMLRNAQNDK